MLTDVKLECRNRTNNDCCRHLVVPRRGLGHIGCARRGVGAMPRVLPFTAMGEEGSVDSDGSGRAAREAAHLEILKKELSICR